MNSGALILTVVLLLVNAYFVVVEFALIASRKPRLDLLHEAGDKRAAAALAAMRDLPRGMGTAQLGITIASLALGYISEPAIAHLIEPVIELVGHPSERVVHAIAFVIALGFISFCHLVLAEMVPRNLSLAAPERVLLLLAPVHRVDHAGALAARVVAQRIVQFDTAYGAGGGGQRTGHRAHRQRTGHHVQGLA